MDDHDDFIEYYFYNLNDTLYRHTNNPLYLWSNYLADRKKGRKISEPMLDYLDKAADDLFKNSNFEKDGNAGKIVRDAFGFGSRGKGTLFTRYNNFNEFLLVLEIYIEVLEKNLSLKFSRKIGDKLNKCTKSNEGQNITITNIDETKKDSLIAETLEIYKSKYKKEINPKTFESELNKATNKPTFEELSSAFQLFNAFP